MSAETWMLVAALALLAAAVVLIPFVRTRREVGEVRRRYDLSDEELDAYLRELPEVCHAVADSSPPGTSAREIKRIAAESTISAILRDRRDRGNR